MKFLILGGTKFLGRHLVEAALAREHKVTLFNRGQTNPELFPNVERLRGDRGGNLEAFKGHKWDAVIDMCGFSSAKVHATAEILADAVEQYTFVSSISVYRNFSKAGLDESAPVALLLEGSVENENDSNTYGARKALCERAAERMMPGRVLNIRPGIIVGPHDSTGRFTHWLRRVAYGSEVLSPAPPEAPVQLIDARDLAEWILRMAEARKVGNYNAAGPASTLTFGQMLEQCKIASGSDARFTWVNEKFLLDNGIAAFSDLPFWIPQKEKQQTGFFAIDCRRAFKSGLTCRPLAETARDILAWERNFSIDSPTRNQAGLTSNRESELLRAWKRG